MKTQSKPNHRAAYRQPPRVVPTQNRVLDVPSGLGFVSRGQSVAFAVCCLCVLVSPYLFSGFWPVTHEYGAQSFFSALAACAALLLALSPRDEAQPSLRKWPLASLCLVAFFAWCALSVLAGVYRHDAILEIARIGTCGLWFLVLRDLLRFRAPDADTNENPNRVLELQNRRALCVMTAAVFGLAIVCALALKNYAETRNPRQFGTFFNPNLFANACAMMLPLALAATLSAWRWARRERSGWTPIVVALGALLSLLIAAGLIITSSKGGFLAALVALLVFSVGLWRAQKQSLHRVARANRVLVALSLLLVLGVGGALATKTVLPRLTTARTSDDNSTQFRVYTWRSTLQMAQARPIAGWGPGGFAQAHDKFALVGTTRSAHQSWLQIAAENGFPALMFLLAASVLFVQHGWRSLKTSWWPQSLGAIGAVVAFAVHALTDAGWGVTSVAFLLTIVFTLLDAAEPNAAPLDATIEYSNGGASHKEASGSAVARNDGSRLRWGWLVVVLVAGAFSWVAQRAASGEDARDESERAQRSGNATMALQNARDAIGFDPLSSRLWLRLAQAQLVQARGGSGDFAGAENAFARATQLNPQNNVAWRLWAQARDEEPQSSTRTPSTAQLWDNAVRLAPRDSSSLLARARWRLKQNADDAPAWNDLEAVVRARDEPFGRYAAVGEYVNLDFARASVLLIP
ncbi:MAG TPA: O-antigen ligase family protein, partial [Abditibacteriaceae bacterium]|nr:O-antigen ligase family protein [Abditibacteriaceae bacterium]